MIMSRGQRKENFIGDVSELNPISCLSRCGVLILTNKKLLWYQVFDYSGMHHDNLVFEAVATNIL